MDSVTGIFEPFTRWLWRFELCTYVCNYVWNYIKHIALEVLFQYATHIKEKSKSLFHMIFKDVNIIAIQFGVS